MTNHSLVVAAMLIATLSTATTHYFFCAGVYGKDHQNYGTAFFLVLSVVNLCDDHNPLVLLTRIAIGVVSRL